MDTELTAFEKRRQERDRCAEFLAWLRQAQVERGRLMEQFFNDPITITAKLAELDAQIAVAKTMEHEAEQRRRHLAQLTAG